MLLTEWQISPKSSDSIGQKYYMKDNYWNLNWNAAEMKYIIPFSKHPVKAAQESYFLPFMDSVGFRIIIIYNRLISIVFTSILKPPLQLLNLNFEFLKHVI